MSNKFRCYVPLAYNVILNVVKNLLVCTHREMFRFAQHDILSINNVIIYVILNVVKNLSVSTDVRR